MAFRLIVEIVEQPIAFAAVWAANSFVEPSI
jgi:hypothetical protein